MGIVKELNIKNQTYYFFDDMIDIRNFHLNLLKIDKKTHKDFDIYCTGYITINKFGDCENIHSVNPFYLVIHSATGYFKEKYNEKCLTFDPTEKYEEVFLELNQKLKRLIVVKNYFTKKIMQKFELILMMIYH